MLSVRSDRPVDPLTVAASRAIDEAARALNLSYFMAGAMARDILLANVHGIPAGVATVDIDFAMAVSGWDQYNDLKARLLENRLFEAVDKIEHRICYRPAGTTTGYPIDIIPFRGVETPLRTIAWPPDHATVMKVIGYEEVLASAVEVRIAPALTMRIASLPGLALLKLFAWQDRHAETAKDARDLGTLFRHYLAAGNRDRVFDSEIALLEAVDYDLDLASPRLLGKDARLIASPDTLRAAETLLHDDRMRDRLLTQMAAVFNAAEDGRAGAANALQQFMAGLLK